MKAKTLYGQLREKISKNPELLQRFETDLTVHDRAEINKLQPGAKYYVIAYDRGTYACVTPDTVAFQASKDDIEKHGLKALETMSRQWIRSTVKHIKTESMKVKVFLLSVERRERGLVYGTLTEGSVEELGSY